MTAGTNMTRLHACPLQAASASPFCDQPKPFVWLCCNLVEKYFNVELFAGVADVGEAQAGLDFAKRFEIIKGAEAKNIRLQAVDLSDESAIADALPRCVA